MQELSFPDIIGTLGVLIVIIAYFQLQIGKIDINNILFSSMNGIGSMMILFSLFYNWNLSSVLIEIFWILISLIGVYNYYSKKKTQ